MTQTPRTRRQAATESSLALARQRHAELSQEARKLLEALLADVNAPAPTKIDWGHVGDLHHLVTELKHLAPRGDEEAA